MKIRSCSDPSLGSQIWRYELGDLETGERESFESHLMVCAACRAEVIRMQSVIGALRPGRADLLARLRTDGVTFDALRRETRLSWSSRLTRWARTRRRRWVLVPAVAAIALAFVLILQSPPRSRYSGMLEFEPLLYERNSARGYEIQEQSDPFRDGMDAYCSGDYEKARTQLLKAVRHDPMNDSAWLYLGISDYLLRDARPAIKALQHAVSSKDSNIRDAGQWYLAQAFLLNNQADSALTRINGLDRGSRWRPRADSLLTKLGELKSPP